MNITNKETDMNVQIVILQRGWVAVGNWSQDGDQCRLDRTHIIRRWGTTRGLGELINGPRKDTVLDPAGTIRFHELTVVARIEADAEKWAEVLR